MPGLSVAELRAAVPGTLALGDPALELILGGTWAALAAAVGLDEDGTITELRDGGATYLILRHRAASVTSISERWGDVTTALDDTDWEIRGDGRSIRRRSDGENPSTWWVGVATVLYEAEDLTAILKLAQIEMVKLEIVSSPGLAMQVVGNWTVQFSQGKTYAELRQSILDSLVTNWQLA